MALRLICGIGGGPLGSAYGPLRSEGRERPALAALGGYAEEFGPGLGGRISGGRLLPLDV